jgi:hypothetical protein
MDKAGLSIAGKCTTLESGRHLWTVFRAWSGIKPDKKFFVYSRYVLTSPFAPLKHMNGGYQRKNGLRGGRGRASRNNQNQMKPEKRWIVMA